MKNTVLRLSLVAVLMVTAVTGAYAQTYQEQDQSLDQDVTVNCTTGAYGQNSSCTVDASQSGDQSQRQVLGVGQRIVYRADGTAIIVHDPVDTGLDLPTTAATVATMAMGSIAAIAKRKNRIS